MKEITIVIPNYNGQDYLKACVESIYKNVTLPFDLIIVDNHSQDISYEWMQEYTSLRFEPLDKNYGFAYAVNRGIELALTPYVVLLNNDTLVEKNWLESLYAKIQKEEDTFSVCGMMVRMGERDKIDDAGDEYTSLGWAYKRYDGKSVEYKRANREKRVFSSCAGAAIYRKKILEKIGYFDEDFFAYLEDVDISYRAFLYGYKNMYTPQARVYHMGSATSGSRYNAFKIYLSARNNIYLIYKNMPMLQIFFNLPFLLVGFLVKYIFFFRLGYGREYWQGTKEGFETLKGKKKTKCKGAYGMRYIKIQALLLKNSFLYLVEKLL